MPFDPQKFTKPQSDPDGAGNLRKIPNCKPPVAISGYPLLPPGGQFIRGPIPLDWLGVAIPLARKALHVAMAIWYCYGFKQEIVIKLTPTKLKPFGVTTETARAILHKFEAAGLVSVDRKRGRSPLVTIKPITNQREENDINGETTTG